MDYLPRTVLETGLGPNRLRDRLKTGWRKEVEDDL